MKSGVSNLKKSSILGPLPIDTGSPRHFSTKSIKLIHEAHAKVTQAIAQHIASTSVRGRKPEYYVLKRIRVTIYYIAIWYIIMQVQSISVPL